MSQDDQKRLAAERAVELVEDGMTIGLGTGSTAAEFVKALGHRVQQGLTVRGVPTSRQTEELAKTCQIPLTSLGDVGALDMAFDGADEVDPQFQMIKGGGGALVREKIVAAASRQVVILVDETKRVACLGRFPLPVEIIPFGARATLNKLQGLFSAFAGRDVEIEFREDQFGEAFVTDGQHYIADAKLDRIEDPVGLATQLNSTVGVVDHGLFIGLCDMLVVGAENGPQIVNKT